MWLDLLVPGLRGPRRESISRKVLTEGLFFPVHIHEGRAQKSLSFIAARSSLLGGLEVVYEHYRGSYGQRIGQAASRMSTRGATHPQSHPFRCEISLGQRSATVRSADGGGEVTIRHLRPDLRTSSDRPIAEL
jgi:hypothetical protein